jgi:hypothetical protein
VNDHEPHERTGDEIMSEQASKTRQVQIQILDADGNWFTPHQVPAVLAALPAIREDMEQYSGSYHDGDLREIRKALRELDTAITKRIGPA